MGADFWRGLETERLLVRRFRPRDNGALAAILADAEVMRHLEPPFSRGQAERFLARAGLGERPLIYAAALRETGALAGYAIFHPWEEDAAWELGWVLARRFWGMGLAGELTAALIGRAREAGIPALVIECAPEQAASVRIATKYGFRRGEPRGGLLVFRKDL